jgi:hypothetical protein
MSDPNQKNQSRRKFLSFGVLAGIGLFASNVSAQPEITSHEKVNMLTQDGKLVEIDKALLRQDQQKKRATKKDILRWIYPARD